jgi:hypothetical protein
VVREAPALIRQLYQNLGKPQRAEELLALDVSLPTPAPSHATTVTLPTNALVKTARQTTPARPQPPPVTSGTFKTKQPLATASTNTFAAITLLHPVVRNIPVRGIIAKQTPVILGGQPLISTIAWAANALWIATIPPVAGPRALTNASLLRYDPAADALENISTRIGPHSMITSIVEHGDNLWFTLEFDGVWRLNAETLEVRKFTAQDGVLTPNMFVSAAEKNRLFFAGEREGRILLNAVDSTTLTWRRLDMAPASSGRAASPIGRISSEPTTMCLCSLDKWLITGPDPWVLFDISNNAAQKLDFTQSKLRSSIRPLGPLGLPTCATDGNGFWLGLGNTLVFFDPNTGTTKTSITLPGPALLIMPEEDWLWVVCNPETSNPAPVFPRPHTPVRSNLTRLLTSSSVLLYHKPSQAWKGRMTVSGEVAALCHSQYYIYFGVRWSAQPILEVAKKTLYTVEN